MTWDRATATAALAEMLGDTGATVYPKPPATLNPPAIVLARASNVDYNVSAFGIDEATLPDVCVGPLEGDDEIDALKSTVRAALLADPTIGGAVQLATATAERNWRTVTISGTELTTVDLVIMVKM